jgi:lipopolysaccharide/colanic/teichoic acid biosynthesis glycosyltransferase
VPQLLNVLRGEMSLVGPRPERPVFVDRFRNQIPYYSERLRVKPGITGLAQVCHKYDETLRDVKRKLAYDLLYIQRMCLMVDLAILFMTVRRLTGKGAR